MQTKAPFGVEFSFIADFGIDHFRKARTDSEEDCIDSDFDDNQMAKALCEVFKFKFQKEASLRKFRKSWRGTNVHLDQDAVEVASPIFYSWKECSSFYDFLLESGKGLPLSTHREDVYSGGGHIHIGISPRNCFGKNLSEETYLFFLVNLFRDLTNRPYLNWIFNEWCDVESAEALFRYRDEVKSNVYADTWSYECFRIATKEGNVYRGGTIQKIKERMTQAGITFTYRNIARIFDLPKGYMARTSTHGTVELRMFDMPQSKEQLAVHVEFAQRYVNHILMKSTARNSMLVPCIMSGTASMKSQASKDSCLGVFKVLVKNIGMDYRRFKPIIKMNYMKRKRRGLLR